MKRIAILAAMGMEAEPLTRGMENLRTEQHADKEFLCGKIGQAEVILHICGVGMRHAAQGVRALVDNYRPDLLLNYGVSGGMMPDMPLGKTVVATSSFPCSGKAYKAGIAEPTDKALAAFAAAILCDTHKSPVCTSQALIINKKRKARIVAQSGAVCIDMESYVIAKITNELGIPLLVIRCLSDTLEPKSLLSFSKNGKAAAEKVAGEVEIVIRKIGEKR